jgi:hypothetical protein
LPSKVAAADQRFSHLISEEALGECRVVDIGGAVAHATQLDCFKQNRTPSCRHPQIFRDIPLRINAARARSHLSLKKGQESTHTSSFSRRRAPELCSSFAPSQKRTQATLKGGRSATPRGEQGRPGARFTRGLACKKRKEHAHEHTGSAEAVRPSLRNGFTAYFVLSLATGFFVTIISEKLASQKLDASIGASEPHDFAVRLTRCSSKAHRRPPHPIPTSVTIAIRPSCGTGCTQ